MMNSIYKLRSSVDLYLYNNETLIIYYMNTRIKKQFKVSSLIVDFLELVDGQKSLSEIHTLLENKLDKEINYNNLLELITKLCDLNVMERVEDIKYENLELYKRYDRQINYFGDFLGAESDSITAQKKLRDSKILIFGCGAIGGDIAIQLAMAGVENFIIYDYDIVEESDVSRHLYFKTEYIGLKKVDALEK